LDRSLLGGHLDFDAAIVGIFYAVLGVNLFLVVWALLERQETPHKYLLVLYLSNLASVLDHIYDLSEWWQFAPQFYNVYIPICYLVAPSLYLYVRSLASPKKYGRFTFFSKHWLGFIMSLALCLPYFFLDTVIKLERLLAPQGSLEHLGIVTIGPFISLLLIVPFCLVYLIASLREISHNNIRIKAFFSDIEDKTLSWARWSIVIFALILILSAFQLFMPASVTENNVWKTIYSLFGYSWLLTIGVMAIKQKSIQIDDRSNIELVRGSSDLENHTKNSQAKPQKKYKNAPLSDGEAQEISDKLISAMRDEQLFETPGLTLRDLTDKLGISQNKASQVLNKHLNAGFYDFVNSWRVAQAKLLIQSESKSLIEIAYEVGFNSKSTFNAAFKKHSEQTPSQYKKLSQNN
jgi:AraC-like DNA-binding protein